jgi:hypothetical protein
MRLLITLVVAFSSAAAQGPAVGFVSPNVRDSMTYSVAKESLSSFEETNFIAVADRVMCALAPRAQVRPVIGEVHEKGKLGLEGAENSTLLRARITIDEMRYAVALLGRYAHQEYVIVFAPRPVTYGVANPPARLVTLILAPRTPRPRVEEALDAAAVLHRTLDGDSVIAFVPEGESEGPIRDAARRLHANLNVQTGVGELIGNDDRVQAAGIYERIIAEFESSHPGRKLSAKLWTAEWHDAISRTCTSAP